jgi:hypothetical protein
MRLTNYNLGLFCPEVSIMNFEIELQSVEMMYIPDIFRQLIVVQRSKSGCGKIAVSNQQ